MSEALETKKQTKSRSLTATLSIAFAILSVVTLLLVSSLALYFDIRSQQAVVAGEQRLIAQSAASEVINFSRERFSELEAAVRLGALIDESDERVEQSLEKLLGLEPAFRQLVLLDEQGQVIAQATRLSQVGGREVTSQLERDALAQIKQDKRYIGPTYIDDTTFEPLIVMAVPVVNIFGENRGALVAETNLKFMWDLVDRLEIGDEGMAYVVDRQGTLLAFGDVTRVIAGENLSHLAEVAKFVNSANRNDPESEFKESGIAFTTGIEGSNVLVNHVPLGTPDWAVVTELPVAEAYRDIVGNIVIFGAIILVVLVIATAAGVLMARRLAAPVQHLTDTVSQVAEGDLKLQAKAEGATEVRQLATAFNRMTGQLNELIGSLENRVAARTQRLETVTRVSEQLLAILDTDQLLVELVNQIKERFEYYHVQVYLIDDGARRLVMTAGSGEAGLQMSVRGHSIMIDARTSLVARAARTGQIVSVSNVHQVTDWLPNPLLPDTCSEMAVPIMLAGQVVGILDVQQNTIGGLDESDASLLRSLANHVAVALRNAQLFDEVETALAEARIAQERYVAQSWHKDHSDSQDWKRLYIQAGMPELSAATLETAQKQALAQKHPAIVPIEADEGNPKSLVAPVSLAGQTIGTLQLHKMGDEDTGKLWTEQDLAFVETILDQVAQSAENLRLFEETRTRASYEQLVGEIAQKLRQAPTLNMLTRIASEELGRAIGISHSLVKLGDLPEEDAV